MTGGASVSVSSHIDWVTLLAKNAVDDVVKYIQDLGDLVKDVGDVPQFPLNDDVSLTEPTPISPDSQFILSETAEGRVEL